LLGTGDVARGVELVAQAVELQKAGSVRGHMNWSGAARFVVVSRGDGRMIRFVGGALHSKAIQR
jgi:hypothetical protein